MTRFFYWKKKYLYAWKYSLVWKSVSLMLFALLVLSCRTTKVNTSARLTDNLTWNRKVSVALATAPSSLAELAIPMDSLRRLPEGAAFTAKSGQAGLRLEVRDNKIHASATCDSLQSLVYELYERLHQARDELERVDMTSEPVAIPFTVRCEWFMAGALTVLLILTIKRIRRKWQEKREIS